MNTKEEYIKKFHTENSKYEEIKSQLADDIIEKIRHNNLQVEEIANYLGMSYEKFTSMLLNTHNREHTGSELYLASVNTRKLAANDKLSRRK